MRKRQGGDKIKMDEQAYDIIKYDTNDAVLQKLSIEYLKLKVNGVDDKENYEIVRKARLDVVKHRTAIESERKKYKEKSLKYGRDVDAEAKRLTSLIVPVEKHLIEQEEIVANEIARVKAEEEAKEAAKKEARSEKLYALGCSLRGGFSLPYAEDYKVPQAMVFSSNDEQFEQICGEFQKLIDIENKRIADEKAAKLAEEERLKKIKAEQEAEAARLAAIAKEQSDREAKIKADQEKIAKEKQRLIDEESERKAAAEREKQRIEGEKKHAEELEKAKKEATAKARNEMLLAIQYQYIFGDLGDMSDSNWSEMYATHKSAWDKKQNDLLVEKLRIEKEEKERMEKIETERQEALKPDKEKLMAFADSIDFLRFPDVKNDSARNIVETVKKSLAQISNKIRKEAREL